MHGLKRLALSLSPPEQEDGERKRAKAVDTPLEDAASPNPSCETFQLERRLTDLQEGYQQALVEVETLQATVAMQAREKDSLSAELAQQQELLRCQGLADEAKRRNLREAWAAEKVVLEKAVRDSEARAANLTQQKAAAERDRDLAAKELAKIKAANDSLRSEGGKARAAHERALRRLQDELEGQKLEVSSCEGQVAALEGQVAELRAAGGRGGTQGAAEGPRSPERELRQAQDQEIEHRRQIEALRGEVGVLSGRVCQLEAELAGKAEVVGVLERDLRGIIRARDVLKAEAETTQAGLRQTLEGLEETLGGVREVQEREGAALRTKVWELQRERKRLGAEQEEAVGGLRRELAQMADLQCDLEAALLEVQGEKADLQAEVEQLKQQALLHGEVHREASACGDHPYCSSNEDLKAAELKWWQVSNEAEINYLADQKCGAKTHNSINDSGLTSIDKQIEGLRNSESPGDEGEDPSLALDVKPDVAALLQRFTERFVDERVFAERLRQEREEASQKIQDLTCQLQEHVMELAALKSTMH